MNTINGRNLTNITFSTTAALSLKEVITYVEQTEISNYSDVGRVVSRQNVCQTPLMRWFYISAIRITRITWFGGLTNYFSARLTFQPNSDNEY